MIKTPRSFKVALSSCERTLPVICCAVIWEICTFNTNYTRCDLMWIKLTSQVVNYIPRLYGFHCVNNKNKQHLIYLSISTAQKVLILLAHQKIMELLL